MFDEKKQKFYIRRDVTFNETDFARTNTVQLHIEEKNEEHYEQESNNKTSNVRRSLREIKLPIYYHDEYASITKAKYTALFVTEVEEPTTLKKAVERDQAIEWKTAADSEYQSLMENKTCELVEPPGRKAISCR